jgi:hypothetical protein
MITVFVGLRSLTCLIYLSAFPFDHRSHRPASFTCQLFLSITDLTDLPHSPVRFSFRSQISQNCLIHLSAFPFDHRSHRPACLIHLFSFPFDHRSHRTASFTCQLFLSITDLTDLPHSPVHFSFRSQISQTCLIHLSLPISPHYEICKFRMQDTAASEYPIYK